MKKILLISVFFALISCSSDENNGGIVGVIPVESSSSSDLSSSSVPSNPPLPPYEQLVVEWPEPGEAGTGTGNPVAYYGALKKCVIEGRGYICGEKTGMDKPVQLKGLSLGWSNPGLNWTAVDFFNAPTQTVDGIYTEWKADVIRATLGVDPASCDEREDTNVQNGYPANPNGNKNSVTGIVDAAIAKGMYVIVDFHTHRGTEYIENAKTFFSEMASEYGNDPHIIWEVWNEPCNWHVWSDVKNYADEIVSIIREHSDNIILVGSPSWSQQPHRAINNEVTDSKNNIAYTFHFYSTTHNFNVSNNITKAMDAGLPVFVTEYGTVEASGSGPHNTEKANQWLDFLDDRYISYASWQINNKFNSTAVFFKTSFDPATAALSAWGNKDSMNGESSKYVFDRLTGAAAEQPWRGNN